MKNRKQYLQHIIEILEQEVILGEISLLFLSTLEPSQPEAKTKGIVVEEAEQKRRKGMLKIAKELLTKEEAASTKGGGNP